MRQAGYLENEKDAQLFSDYLHSKGIANEAEPTRDGPWAIWIHDDAHLSDGKQELERFAADPTDPVYRENAGRGRAFVAEKQKEDEQYRNQMVDVRTTWVGMNQWGIGWLTAILIGMSVILSLFSQFGDNMAVRFLFSYDAPQLTNGNYWFGDSFEMIRSGQIWRVVTPIFLHFSIMHLLFNMLWLKQLGTAIEFRQGTWALALQILVYAVLSNTGEYLVSGPFFGGMSGVVYGLFAYVWIRGKYDPRRPYSLDKNSVIMMVAWFFLCFTGLVGPIANTAHAVGLVAGIVWAAIAVRRVPFTGIRF